MASHQPHEILDQLQNYLATPRARMMLFCLFDCFTMFLMPIQFKMSVCVIANFCDFQVTFLTPVRSWMMMMSTQNVGGHISLENSHHVSKFLRFIHQQYISTLFVLACFEEYNEAFKFGKINRFLQKFWDEKSEYLCESNFSTTLSRHCSYNFFLRRQMRSKVS